MMRLQQQHCTLNVGSFLLAKQCQRELNTVLHMKPSALLSTAATFIDQQLSAAAEQDRAWHLINRSDEPATDGSASAALSVDAHACLYCPALQMYSTAHRKISEFQLLTPLCEILANVKVKHAIP
eukprot:6173097-Pleurochrysis_carterae.AAC.1